MAVRKTSTGKTTKKSPLKSASGGKRNRVPISAAFWIFLLIVMIITFFMLMPVVKKNLTIGQETTETEQGTGNREQGAGSREQGAMNNEAVEKPFSH